MPRPRYAFAAVLLAVLACASAASALAQSYRPGDIFRDCPTCPEMVVVPAGSFQMGSPSGEEDPRACRLLVGLCWRCGLRPFRCR